MALWDGIQKRIAWLRAVAAAGLVWLANQFFGTWAVEWSRAALSSRGGRRVVAIVTLYIWAHPVFLYFAALSAGIFIILALSYRDEKRRASAYLAATAAMASDAEIHAIASPDTAQRYVEARPASNIRFVSWKWEAVDTSIAGHCVPAPNRENPYPEALVFVFRNEPEVGGVDDVSAVQAQIVFIPSRGAAFHVHRGEWLSWLKGGSAGFPVGSPNRLIIAIDSGDVADGWFTHDYIDTVNSMLLESGKSYRVIVRLQSEGKLLNDFEFKLRVGAQRKSVELISGAAVEIPQSANSSARAL